MLCWGGLAAPTSGGRAKRRQGGGDWGREGSEGLFPLIRTHFALIVTILYRVTQKRRFYQ